MDFSQIRGFNYMGSWGTSALDLWQHHDHGRMAVEVSRGKGYFPAWNVARWWLSHESFQRDPQRFLANFDAGLAIFSAHEIRVMPVLFNRWRDPVCDFGGVSMDHIVDGWGDHRDPSEGEASVRAIWGRYLEQVVGGHGADPRIFAWDLSNEPLTGRYMADADGPIPQAELRWLTWCRDTCRTARAQQPITVGSGDLACMRLVEPLVDFLSFHPYFMGQQDNQPAWFVSSPEVFETALDEAVAFADNCDKALLATETAWGAVDDAERVRLLRYTLRQLTGRNLGFMVHALHHSLVADLHAADYGPVGIPGRLEFIDADGSLRPGHEAYNEFVG